MSGFYKLLSALSNVAVHHNYFSSSHSTIKPNQQQQRKMSSEEGDPMDEDDVLLMEYLEKERCQQFLQKFANEVNTYCVKRS